MFFGDVPATLCQKIMYMRRYRVIDVYHTSLARCSEPDCASGKEIETVMKRRHKQG